jgi:hypothetical protein
MSNWYFKYFHISINATKLQSIISISRHMNKHFLYILILNLFEKHGNVTLGVKKEYINMYE